MYHVKYSANFSRNTLKSLSLDIQQKVTLKLKYWSYVRMSIHYFSIFTLKC
jgi:hypothetical protein